MFSFLANCSICTNCSICNKDNFREFCFKNHYSCFQCLGCGFIFTYPEPNNLAELYKEDYLSNCEGGWGYVDYEQDKNPMAVVYCDILEKIKLYRSGIKLLDLGAANGYFLNIANQNGYQAEGIDFNLSAVKEGINKGRKIKYGDFLNSDYQEEEFDVVAAFDFIEHLPRSKIENYMKIINKILKKNGILAIITLDSGSLWSRLLGKRWQALLPPEHLIYFNKKNIKLFLEKNNFRVLETKTINKRFSLQYIFSMLHRWQNISLWLHITKFLRKNPWLASLALKIYIGDNMFILAQKID